MSQRSPRLTTDRSALRQQLSSTYSPPSDEEESPSEVTESSDEEELPSEVAESADEEYMPESPSEMDADVESWYAEYSGEHVEPEFPAMQESLFMPEIWLAICDFLPDSDVSSVSHTDRFRRSLLRTETLYIFRRNVIHSESSCLPYVAARGDLALVQTMQTYPGFKADATDDDGDTALLCAIQLGHIDLALSLIETQGDHVNIRNERHGYRPLTLAARLGCVEVVRRLTLCPNIEVNGAPFKDSGRPLLDACKYGNPVILELILGCPKIDTSIRDSLGRTALHIAARHNQTAITESLITDGRFAFTAIDALGWSAMDAAIQLGCYDFIAVMQSHGIIPAPHQVRYAQHRGNFKSKLIHKELDRPGNSAHLFTMIACAAARGNLELVSLFLPEAGAKQLGDALCLASAYGHMEVSKLLLKHVNSNFQDRNGRTARWYARQWGHRDIVKLLVDSQPRKKRKREVDDTRGAEGGKRNPILIDGDDTGGVEGSRGNPLSIK